MFRIDEIFRMCYSVKDLREQVACYAWQVNILIVKSGIMPDFFWRNVWELSKLYL